MLFGYPIAATDENWVHDCLCEIVLAVHDCIAGGIDLPAWPLIAPLDCREKISNRPGLEGYVATYAGAAAQLSIDELAFIADVMQDQNRIPELLSGVHHCLTVDKLPKIVQIPLRDLFKFGFYLLEQFGIRDRQYALIWNGIKYRVCPFCGCENFNAPGGKREALDHYLADSRYPFAASNLRHLVPMGHKCNSSYKLAKDILQRDDGARRTAFDPYQTGTIEVVLSKSKIGENLDEPFISEWTIEFSIETAEIETWDDVFRIRERYRDNVLEEYSSNAFLEEFRNSCIATQIIISNDGEMLNAMERHEQYLTLCGYNDRAFLKAAVFKMLLGKCNEGCLRVLALIRDLVGLPQPI